MSMTVGELVAFLRLDDSQFNRGLDSAQSKFGRMGGTMGRIGSTVGKVAFTGAALGIGALGAGLAAGAVAGIKYNSSIEQTTIAMGTMLGSTEQATALIAEVTKMAAATPFEFPELADATKRLVAYGVAADDAVPLMTRLGDISSALSIPIGELSDIYGKMKVSGRIQMEDINQLAGRGIPIYSALGKVLGVDEGKVRDLVSAGKVGFPMIEQAFEDMTDKGSMFGGMMEKQSKSFAGLWSTLKDNVTAVFATAAKPLFNWLTETAMPKAIAMVDKFSAGFAKGGFEGGLKAVFGEGVASDLISTFGIIKATVVGIVKVLATIGGIFIGLPSEVKKFALSVAALPLALKGLSILSSGKSIFENLFGKGGMAAANVPLQGAMALNTAATEANTLALMGKGGLPVGGAPGPGGAAPVGAPAAAGWLSKLKGPFSWAGLLGMAGMSAGNTAMEVQVSASDLAEMKQELGLAGTESAQAFTTAFAAGITPASMSQHGGLLSGLDPAILRAREELARLRQDLRRKNKLGDTNTASTVAAIQHVKKRLADLRANAARPAHTGHLNTAGWLGPLSVAAAALADFRFMASQGITAGSMSQHKSWTAAQAVPAPAWHAPGRALGGFVPRTPGGTLLRVGEGKYDEVVAQVLPGSGKGAARAGGDIIFNIANVNGTDRAAAEKFADMVGGILMQQVRYG